MGHSIGRKVPARGHAPSPSALVLSPARRNFPIMEQKNCVGSVTSAPKDFGHHQGRAPAPGIEVETSPKNREPR